VALTTLFGSAQLALQDAISSNLERVGLRVAAPNFVTVSLRRSLWLQEFGSGSSDYHERIRRDLEGAMRRFIESHGWSVAGSGVITMNVLIRTIDDDCHVQARVTRGLYEIRIRDDHGARPVRVSTERAVLGRPHSPEPRGFIPLYDGLRLVSREHIELRYRDLILQGHLLGRNPTTLNDRPFVVDADVPLQRGDVIRCGTCELTIIGVE
jgi:hypothetical protein